MSSARQDKSCWWTAFNVSSKATLVKACLGLRITGPEMWEAPIPPASKNTESIACALSVTPSHCQDPMTARRIRSVLGHACFYLEVSQPAPRALAG